VLESTQKFRSLFFLVFAASLEIFSSSAEECFREIPAYFWVGFVLGGVFAAAAAEASESVGR